MSSPPVLAVDGHGVIYHRPTEVVDALVKYMYINYDIDLDQQQAKAEYLSAQTRAFANEISYREMLEEYTAALGFRGGELIEELDEAVQRFSAAITLEPEVPGTLRELRDYGVYIGMLTNSIHPASVKRQWLLQFEIHELFDVIFSSVEEECRKPDPLIFTRFADRVDHATSEIVFVAHDLQEIAGAKQAGTQTVGLRCDSDATDYTIESFGELLDLPIWPTTLQQGRRRTNV